jgi:hypothetical protein
VLFETFLAIQRSRVSQRLTTFEQRAQRGLGRRPALVSRKRKRSITAEDHAYLDAIDDDDDEIVRSTDALDHQIEPLDGIEDDDVSE